MNSAGTTDIAHSPCGAYQNIVGQQMNVITRMTATTKRDQPTRIENPIQKRSKNRNIHRNTIFNWPNADAEKGALWLCGGLLDVKGIPGTHSRIDDCQALHKTLVTKQRLILLFIFHLLAHFTSNSPRRALCVCSKHTIASVKTVLSCCYTLRKFLRFLCIAGWMGCG